MRYERTRLTGALIGIPEEVLLDCERRASGERTVNAVILPAEVGIAVVRIHQDPRAWMGRVFGIARARNCSERGRANNDCNKEGREKVAPYA